MSDKGGHSKPYLNFDQHLNNFFYCKRMTNIMGVVCNKTHPLLPKLSCHRNELMSRPFWYCPRGEIEENLGRRKNIKQRRRSRISLGK